MSPSLRPTHTDAHTDTCGHVRPPTRHMHKAVCLNPRIEPVVTIALLACPSLCPYLTLYLLHFLQGSLIFFILSFLRHSTAQHSGWQAEGEEDQQAQRVCSPLDTRQQGKRHSNLQGAAIPPTASGNSCQCLVRRWGRHAPLCCGGHTSHARDQTSRHLRAGCGQERVVVETYAYDACQPILQTYRQITMRTAPGNIPRKLTRRQASRDEAAIQEHT